MKLYVTKCIQENVIDLDHVKDSLQLKEDNNGCHYVEFDQQNTFAILDQLIENLADRPDYSCMIEKKTTPNGEKWTLLILS